MNKKLREILEELSFILILGGILLVALSGDAYTNGEMNFGEYLVFALKLFIPGIIGILMKVLLYINKVKLSNKTTPKAVVMYALDNSDKRFSEIQSVLDNVNKIK